MFAAAARRHDFDHEPGVVRRGCVEASRGGGIVTRIRELLSQTLFLGCRQPQVLAVAGKSRSPAATMACSRVSRISIKPAEAAACHSEGL
jgi:hypothetical protein